MVMETMRILRHAVPAPRRTVRAVLYTAEETGIQGGKQYARDHAGEITLHTAALEADAGAGAVTGIGISAGDGGIAMIEKIAEILAGMGVSEVSNGGGGPDISPLAKAGVPTLSFRQNTTYYFDYHHSDADTLDKVDRQTLNRNTAAMAVLAYMLADLEEPLPRLPVQEDLTP
jgi:Zn-dependent M28 family amino/carboxypeptidase